MPDSVPPTVSGLPADKLIAAALSSTPVSSPAFAWVPPAVEEVVLWFPEYEIQSLAGRGAMGAVYRAVQRKLSRPVAIKLLPAELAAREGVEARFEREARALARLNHPGIVALHDFGRTGRGHLFIVMEYVDGTDLSRLIHAEGGGLGVEHALEITGQVCDALQYAHSRGFVHRDIKPGNVLVDKDGRVKIADFGLAKVTEESGAARWTSDAAGPAAPHSPLTLTGQALGTPDYTAPEQLKGGPVDHRADIYSLGVMFYEMLTGELPRGAWPPPSTCTAAPARLDEVVTRAMQTEPANRYQQASEVKAAATAAPIVPPAKPKRTAIERFLPWAMLALAAWVVIVCPVKNWPTLLMNAGPFAVLAFVFHRWRTGMIGGMLAGAATMLAVMLTVFTLDQSGKPHPDGALAQEIRKAEAELSALLVDYGNNHPRVQKAQTRLDRLRNGRWVEPSDRNSPTTDSGTTISAPQDGRLEKLSVVEGQNVLPGELVASMDSTAIKMELEALKRNIMERLTLEIRQGEAEILNLGSELREYQISEAEDSAVIKELTEFVKNVSDRLSGRPEFRESHSDLQKAKMDLGKVTARQAVAAQHQAEIQISLGQLKARMQEPAKTLAALKPVELADRDIVPLLSLAADERNRRDALLFQLDHCTLISPCAGKVTGISKQPGEFIKAGETLLQIIPTAAAAEAPAK